MNIEEAAKELSHMVRTPRQKEALETLYAVAIERDEMARQAEELYNELAQSNRVSELYVVGMASVAMITGFMLGAAVIKVFF